MSKKDIQQAVCKAVKNMPQRHNIKKIALFGSYLHDSANADSDVDLLLELREPVGFFELTRMQSALEMALGKDVDLVEPEALSKYFRAQVLQDAEPLYEG